MISLFVFLFGSKLQKSKQMVISHRPHCHQCNTCDMLYKQFIFNQFLPTISLVSFKRQNKHSNIQLINQLISDHLINSQVILDNFVIMKLYPWNNQEEIY
ncbi:hypothetical protein ABPG74_001184 [Tetrahymena malaccensis]